MLEPLTGALSYMDHPAYWIAFFVALGLAGAHGLIPGLGSIVMMSIALPIVLLGVKDPAIGIVMLACIAGSGNTLDTIPAQLMGIVHGSTQVAFLEGHQLARKGKGAYSLGAVYAVSAIGGIVGAICLLIAIPVLKPVILHVGFAEIAMLGIFGIVLVGVLSTGAMVKGLASGALGIFLGTVGLQSYTGIERFTFGSYDLRAGLPLVAVISAAMAVPEMIDLAVSRKPVAPAGADFSRREVFRGFREGLRRWKIAVRHSVFGVVLGAIPGTGGTVITWMSYGLGMAMTKDKSEFGKGSLDGLLFAEAAENAKEGGQAIPTLALGVPGGASWALVMAALISYGIAPGPDILTTHADIVGLMVISFGLANLVMAMFALLITPQLMWVTRIPYAAIVGPVLPILVLGAYFEDLTMMIVPIMIVMTIVGLTMKRYGWPRPPLILGFILAPVVENNLWSAFGVYGVKGTLTRPLTIVLFVLTIVVTVYLQRAMRKSAIAVSEGAESFGLAPDAEPVASVVGTGQAALQVGSVGGPAVGADGSAVGVDDLGVTAERRRRLYWRNEHILPLVLVVVSVYVIYVTAGYSRTGARWLPMSMACAFGGLSLYQLMRQAFQPGEIRGRILDLDMRSSGLVGSRRASVITSGLLVMYMLCVEGFGIKWAGIPFAILTSILLMQGKRRYLVAGISLAVYCAFVVGVGDHLLAIYWPTGWFTS